MPLYDYQCDGCNVVFEAFNRMNHCRYSKCPKCGHAAHQVFITPPMAYKEILPYYDHGLGAHVNDRAERKRIMEQKGLVEADPAITQKAKETLVEHADNAASKRR